MKISLEIEVNGELKKKVFSTQRMRGRALKRALEVQDVFEESDKQGLFTSAHFDLMCEFICEMFGGKFTIDELLDGMDLEEIQPTFIKLQEEVQNKTMAKVNEITKK